MTKLAKAPRWVVDTLGALIVLGALLAVGWLGVVETAEARSRMTDCRNKIATFSTTLSALDLQRNEQQLLLADHERALTELGADRPKTTVEEYLQTVAALVRKHDVRLIQHGPSGERRYPGLREQLFSFRVSGTTENLWWLFRKIEKIDAWADVSYMKLEGGDVGVDRTASFTVSLFFEQELAPSAGADGGQP